MKFIADFHIHSRFSRATAKNLDFENIYIAAQLKGITVVGTGDFTHPGWFAEIKEKLVAADPDVLQIDRNLSRQRSLATATLEHPVLEKLIRQRQELEIPNRLRICAGPMIVEAIEMMAARR